MTRARSLIALALLWPATALATEFWQDQVNTNGNVSVVTPPGGSCFLYQTAAFDVQCYTTLPAGFVSGVPTGVLEGVAGAITGYTATNHLVQYGAASGGGLAQSTGFAFDGTSTIGIAAPSSGVQESLQGSNSASFAQLSLFPAGGTAVTELLNLVPKGAGAGVVTSGVVIYNTDLFADPSNTERLLIEGRGTNGYIIDSSSTGTGTTRAISIGTDASVPPKQLVLNTSGSTTFGTGDLLLTRLTSQSLLKTGGGLTVGTGDADTLSVVTNTLLRMSIASTGGITVPSFSGGGNQCAFFDNTGLLSVTGSACGTGSGAGGITQLTGDGTAGPGSGSQAFTLVNLPNDVSQAGDLLATSIVAPAAPSAGKARLYVDSTSKNFAAKNDAGTINHGAQTAASSAGVALTGLANDGSWTTQNFQAPLVACTDYVSLACVTGATDLGGSNATPTVIGIENDATMRGDLLATNIAAPATPAAGKARIYVDSTSQALAVKNDTGAVSHTVKTATCPPSRWFEALGNDGGLACTQPAFADLSGSATCAQLPALTGDTTSSAGSCATLVSAFEDGTTQKGVLNVSTVFAPSTPAAGTVSCWVDHFNGNYECKDSAASLYAIPKATTCSAGQAVSAITAGGTVTCSAPSVACSQMPAFTGDVTKPSGSCATTVASVACAALPALTGGVTKPSGSCATTLDGPSVAAATTKLTYSLQLMLGSNTPNTWLLEGGPGLWSNGAVIEYPNNFKASRIQVIWYMSSNIVLAGTLSVFAAMNGAGIGGTGFAITPATGTGVHVGTNLPTGSSSSSDTYGLVFTTDNLYSAASPSSVFLTVEVMLMP